MRQAITFDSMAKPQLVLGKLAQLNAERGSAALDDAELRALTDLTSSLAGAAGGPAAAPAAALAPAALDALVKALGWPLEAAYPPLDILRLALLHPAGAARVPTISPPLVPSLLAALAGASGAPAPTLVMALRVLCNMCAVPRLHASIGEHVNAVLEAASEHLNAGAHTVRVPAATLLLNFAIFIAGSAAAEEEAQAQILSAVAPALVAIGEGDAPDDLALRLLATVGTLAHSKLGATFVRRLAADLGIGGAVAALGARAKSSDAVKACAAQLGQLLAATG